MAYCNINGNVMDQFNRYQMPVVDCHYQGRKTIICNLKALGKSLARPEHILLSFWSQTLGCGKVKNGLNGQHSKKTLQDTLQLFIADYVLCSSCSNPETELYAFSKVSVEKSCKACGYVSTLEVSSHKLVKCIVKYV
jgi:translation initiation factor 2 beta subunit (eIF-2beta)/eIF-5